MDSTLKNRMTVRKGIPLPEKQRICVPKEKHAAEMGQEAFSGRTAQRKQANPLIRRECCNYEDGNCMLLDDGDAHTCPQAISFSVCCKWFRWSVLPQRVRWKQRFSGERT